MRQPPVHRPAVAGRRHHPLHLAEHLLRLGRVDLPRARRLERLRQRRGVGGATGSEEPPERRERVDRTVVAALAAARLVVVAVVGSETHRSVRHGGRLLVAVAAPRSAA
ncbi:hypothetical protein GCM10025868_37570 [Angustibacter aerolatus]|uniref:Uncharacterized protein n=1 Tax=Angustibacter aerolatus TaxID=1162965 RepID=A0ABQ6JL50_9ACTN|nr:hypothetical protein GCM10025868_37570 [Angustibacter aerolatus]